MSDFKREERYIVIKHKRIDQDQGEAIREVLDSYQIPTEDCVVVEHDWPIYESVWEMIQGLYEGNPAAPRPAHYAVIDEHGEIVQAFKVASYRNAEFLCKSLIQLISHDHDTSGWTVKGVTIHN